MVAIFLVEFTKIYKLIIVAAFFKNVGEHTRVDREAHKATSVSNL